jgi:hypothetical protein
MDTRQTGTAWLFKEMWAFGQIPPEDTALILGKAILVCAHGGSGIAPEERAWVIGYFCALGYSDALIRALEDYDPAEHAYAFAELIAGAPMLAQPDARLALLYDGIRAAVADKILDDGELAAIKRLAAMIGVEDETVDQLIDAYAAEVQAKSHRLLLCFPSGVPF